MRKITFFMLMAVGLLISGNLRADNVCKIVGGQEYATVQEAINAAESGQTVQMLANDVVEESITDLAITYAYTIPSGKEIVLDLNGQRIYRKRDVNKGYAIFDVKGKLTIDDNSPEKNGELYIFTDQLSSYGASIACVNVGTNGELIVNNGNLICDRPQAGTFYCLDVAAQAKVTINGGLLWNKQKTVIRLGNDFGSSTTLVEFTMNGGEIKGEYGVYCQGAKGKLKATFLGGEIDCLQWVFESENNKAPGTFDNYEITISGGVYNGYFDLGALYDGSAVRQGTQKLSVTGGNFISDNGIRTQNGETAFIKGGIYYFESGKIESLVVHNDVQFTSDAEGALCVTYDGYSKWRGDLATKQGWEQLGYIVKPSSDHPEPEGTWWKIYKYTESTENYSNFLTYIADGYMAVDISGTKEGRTDEQEWPDKTVIVKKVETKEITENGELPATEPNDSVVIKNEANVTIGDDTNPKTVEVYSLNVEDGGSLTIGSKATVIVGDGGFGNDQTTVNVTINSTDGSTGIVKVSPDAPKTKQKVHVNLYTNAHSKYEGSTIKASYWQLFARPTELEVESFGVVTNPESGIRDLITNIYGYDGSHWVPLHSLTDLSKKFEGYAISNNTENGGVVYQFTGWMCLNDDAELKFNHGGFTLMGNSYLAPVSLQSLFEGILDLPAERTIWYYESELGSYKTVTFYQSKTASDYKKTQLEPMQGFFMYLTTGSSLNAKIDYTTAVWNQTLVTHPLPAPALGAKTMNMVNIIVSANGKNDELVVYEDNEFSPAFDNGADATKMMNLSGMFNLYVATEGKNYSNFATDNLDGTILTFNANAQREYTLSFSDANTDYLLVDLLTGEKIEMTEGNTYTFMAEPNSTVERFQIVPTAMAPTAIKNTKSAVANKVMKNGMLLIERNNQIYTVQGQNVK